MTPLIVPTLNSNDTDAKLQLWMKRSGDEVSSGEVVAVLETTKASYDLTAETDGVLSCEIEEGEFCAFGSTVGAIFNDRASYDFRDSNATKPKFAPIESPSGSSSGLLGGLSISKAARELIAQHRIPEQALLSLGKSLVRASDLAGLITESADDDTDIPTPSITSSDTSLSRRQSGVARLVTRAHREIPAALHVKRIRVDRVLDALRSASQKCRVMLGLPELMVWIASRLGKVHSECFGTILSTGDHLDHHKAIAMNIGITIDLGHGLFIPVIRDADTLTLSEIAGALMAFRAKARRDEFDSEDLCEGVFSISLNNAPDTVLVQPLIQWPQTSMLSISAVLNNVKIDDDGNVQPVREINLALAYDHRIINGSMADGLLSAFKEQIETPAGDDWL